MRFGRGARKSLLSGGLPEVEHPFLAQPPSGLPCDWWLEAEIVLRWRSVRLLSQGVALKAEDLLPGVVTWEHGMDRTWSRKQISCRFHGVK